MSNKIELYEKNRIISKKLNLYLEKTFKKKEVKVILPDNLRRADLIASCPEGFNETRWVQGCWFIVSSIISMQIEGRTPKKNAAVHLNAEVLNANIGKEYKIMISFLMDSNIIINVAKETKHKRSRTYMLGEKYKVSYFKYRNITDKGIVKAVLRFRAESLKNLKVKIKPISHLARWLTYEKLEIDKVAALEFLEQYKIDTLKDIKKRKLKKKYESDINYFVEERVNRAKIQIENWEENNNISIDDSGGRLYSKLTSIMSPLKNFLKHDGEPLVSFDIKNSQPLHFMLTIKEEFWKKKGSRYRLAKLNEELYNSIKEDIRRSLIITLGKPSQITEIQNNKNPNFSLLVKYGKLYEFICNRFYKKFLNSAKIDRFSTRNKSKKEMLHMMYHNPTERYTTAREPFKEFSKYFPVEAKVMAVLKSNNYKDFPRMLQKLEAQILLQDVCKKIFVLNSEIPLYTIHDSILTTEKYADIVYEVISKTYYELLGFYPQLERKGLSELGGYQDRKKYIKGKIDQAEIDLGDELSPAKEILPIHKFINISECEHANFDNDFKKQISQEFSLNSFCNITILPEGYEKIVKDVVNPFDENPRKLKKRSL